MSIQWWEKTIHDLPWPSLTFHDLPSPSMTFYHLLRPLSPSMIKCLLSRPGLIAGPLQINSQSIPRLDPIDSKSSRNLIITIFKGWCLWWPLPLHPRLVAWECADRRAVLTNVRPGDIQGGLAYVRQVSKNISEILSWHYFYTFIDRVTKQNGENGIQCSGNN